MVTSVTLDLMYRKTRLSSFFIVNTYLIWYTLFSEVIMLTNITLNNYTTFINETIFDFNAINYESLKKTNVNSNQVLYLLEKILLVNHKY